MDEKPKARLEDYVLGASEDVMDILAGLKQKGEIYSPKKGRHKLAPRSSDE